VTQASSITERAVSGDDPERQAALAAALAAGDQHGLVGGGNVPSEHVSTFFVVG
jgi:hypothetical protein